MEHTSTDPPTDTPFQQSDVPCAIHLVNGKLFVVEAIGAWGYVPQGIFASGRFHGESKERDIVISKDRVDWIELDFATLKKHIETQHSGLTVVGDAGE